MKNITEDKVKKFDFVKKPIKVKGFFGWLSGVLAKGGLIGYDFKLNKIGMEGLEPPYLVLGMHASYLDLNTMLLAMLPHKANYVCALDAIRDHTEWLMRKIGIIGKRKFIKDLHLLRNMRYCIETLKSVLIMYPEAKFSLDGTTSFLPVALGKLAKFLDVPVVTVIMNGNYVGQPQWNKKKKKIPLHTTARLLYSRDEVRSLPQEELQAGICAALRYDDFEWQKQNGIVIDDPKRAEGLDKLLYQCPHCKTEFKTYSHGTTLECRACGKKWEMTELGELKATEGETEFSHIPDWFAWQKENIKRQLDNGEYFFEDEVIIDTLPNAQTFYRHGKGVLTHSAEGFRLRGTAYNQPIDIEWKGISTDGVHIEYNYHAGKVKRVNGDLKIDKSLRADVLDISTQNDSFWLYPLTQRNVITKISLACDEIYQRSITAARKH